MADNTLVINRPPIQPAPGQVIRVENELGLAIEAGRIVESDPHACSAKLDTVTAASDSQVGGDHYSKLGAYQPWAVLAEWLTPEELRGFAKGTVIAYLARERDKGGDQDIAKSLHTLQLFEQYRKDKA